MNQISLALDMLFILKSRSIVKKEELANRLEISLKQVQRIKNQLQIIGYNIQTIPGNHGGYRLNSHSPLVLTQLTANEKTALANALKYLLNLSHPLISQSFKSGYLKISANFNESLLITSIQKRNSNFDATMIADFIEQLNYAILRKTRVKLDYFNNKAYYFEPYELFSINQDNYVVGYVKFESLKTFKLNRIKSLQLTDEQFIRDDSFNLNQIITNQGFKINKPVVLEATITNRNYLMEYQIGEIQNFEIINENSFHCQIQFPNDYSLKGFILECGADIFIHSPQKYREFQINNARNVLTLYNNID